MAHVEDDSITLELLTVNLCPRKRPKYKKREMEFFIRLVTGYPYARLCVDLFIFVAPSHLALRKPYLIPTVVLESTPGPPLARLSPTPTETKISTSVSWSVSAISSTSLKQKGYVVYMTTSILSENRYFSETTNRGPPSETNSATSIEELSPQEITTCLSFACCVVWMSKRHSLISSQFGASVLLDPTIDIRTRIGIPTLSATFPKYLCSSSKGVQALYR